MTCADFDRWLDAGMPERDTAGRRAHARSCARCAAALDAARAIESALLEESLAARTAPVRAPATLAPAVAARVRAAESARARAIESSPAPRWWIGLVSDPLASVSFTTALIALGILIWNPSWIVRLGSRFGAHWLAWVGHAGEIPGDPMVWLALLATATFFALWGLLQIGRKVERALVLQLTRPGS